MRIGINLLYLIPGIVGGTETYAAGLLHGLAEIDELDEFVVFVNKESENWPIPEASNFNRVVCPVYANNRIQRYLFEQLRLPKLLIKHRINLVHSPGYVMPLKSPCPSIVSILDIVYEYPGAYSFLKKQILKILVGASARRADHILTISESSRKQILSRFNIQPEKVTVTLLAHKLREKGNEQNWTELNSKFGIFSEYLLTFSSLSPSKNIPMLLKAFAQLLEKLNKKIKLVLVGHEPGRGESLKKIANELGLQDSVIFTGYLSDKDLSLLLSHAMIFVFPSLYEGFGLPVLEAMSNGIPTICSNVASLPEVAGDAALFFNPGSLDEITKVLQSLIADPDLRDELIAKGYKNVQRFSWTKTAETTLSIYNKILSN
jgi:glycosyltransferase involved in cell wall biosynthesis